MNQKASKKQADSKLSFIKRHNVALIVASCLAVIILLPVLYMGWLGFMPGVSSVFGADKPRDLGVRYDNADLQAYGQKTSIAVMDSPKAPTNPSNPVEKQLLTNPKYAKDLVLTDEEVTANINSLANTLSWLPTENLQIRFNDGTLEISGMLNLDKADEFNEQILGQGSPGVNAAISWAKRFDSNVPFYVKLHASVENNSLTYKIEKAEIGRAAVPLSLFGKDVSEQSSAYIKATNFSIDYAHLSDGKLTFSGLYPTVIYLDY